MPYSVFKFFSRNTQGRDFVVGDIHGHFTTLERMLMKVNFDPRVDRVFSVGDLIDRGPESHRCIEFLNYNWFHAIMGNHEKMLLDAAHDTTIYRSWTEHNGGHWWKSIPTTLRPRLREILGRLPLAFEIDTPIGRIGIVHADIPPNSSWQTFISHLKQDEYSEFALWSRQRYKQLQLMGRSLPIEGIDLVIFGHTPVEKTLHQANICYIDTGACYPNEPQLGKLTLLQISPALKTFSMKTNSHPIPGINNTVERAAIA